MGLRAERRVPLSYGDSVDEQRAVLADVGLIDYSSESTIRVAGPDRHTFLQGLVSNDMRLDAGQACRTAVLTAKGKIRWIVGVIARDDELLISLPGRGQDLLAFLDSYWIREDIALSDASADWAVISLQGPNARPTVNAVLQDGGQCPDRDGFSAWSAAVVAGTEILLIPHDRSGAGGVDLWVPRSEITGVWARLAPTATLVGHQAMGDLSLVAGIPQIGVDATEDTLLPEIPYEHLVSWTKGCYLGQEPVARVKHRGRVARALTAFDLSDPVAPGVRLVDGGKDVGWITSQAWSVAQGRRVALGYLKVGLRKPGQRLEVKVHDDDTAPEGSTWADVISVAHLPMNAKETVGQGGEP